MGKVRAHVHVHAVASGAVVMALSQRLPERFAGESRRQQTGQTAVGTKQRGAWITGAWASFVAIAVRDNAHTIAQAQGVVQQPLKGAPGRVNFYGALQTR